MKSFQAGAIILMEAAAAHPKQADNLPRMHNQIDKMVRCHTFLGSETLSKLLQFLAERSLNDPDTPLKEYEIATEVMGRRADFDPRVDSAVRVQVARLRTKLTEYMSNEGLEDPYLVEVPRGSYKLTFTPNPKFNGAADASAQFHFPKVPASDSQAASHPLPQTAEPAKSRWRIVASLVVVLAAIFIGLLAWLRGYIHFGRPATPQTAVKEFWQPFLADPQGPLTVLSNAPFAGNAITGLHYDLSSDKAAASVHSYYTGIGEAVSIHKLDAVFAQLGAPLRVQPGSLLSVEDVKDTNLIFIGSPAENLMAKKVVTLSHFDFRELTTGPRTGQVVIDNHQPFSGESAIYMASSMPNAPLVDDFAIIAHMPVDDTHDALVAAGTTTIGTEAAVDFLCQPDTLRLLRQRLGAIRHGDTFELLLHIKIVDDVPMKEEIVTVRRG
jgi:hypothetical protein